MPWNVAEVDELKSFRYGYVVSSFNHGNWCWGRVEFVRWVISCEVQGGLLARFSQVTASEVVKLICVIVDSRNNEINDLYMHPHFFRFMHVPPNDLNIEPAIFSNYFNIAFDIYAQSIEPGIV